MQLTSHPIPRGNQTTLFYIFFHLSSMSYGSSFSGLARGVMHAFKHYES
jgi:hypothetical protein